MIEECRLHRVGLHCGSKSIGLSVLSFTGPCYGQTNCTNFFGGSIERMQFAFQGIHGSMPDSSMQPDRESRSRHASTRSLCSNICFARPSFPRSRLLHPQYLHHKTQHSPILILTRSITSASQSTPFPPPAQLHPSIPQHEAHHLPLPPLPRHHPNPSAASPIPAPADYGSYPAPEGGYGSYAGVGSAEGAAAEPAPPR